MKRDTDNFQFRIEQREALYRGFYQMDRLTISHQRFQGGEQTITREMMDRRDAACVLLVDLSRDEVVLIEQFRVGAINTANPWLLEAVAGLIDKQAEIPEQVARREAVEEAGVELGRLHPIAHYLPSPGGSNENVYLYIAEADASSAKGVHGLDEEGEDIRVLRVPFAQAFAACRDGTINNAATLIALQWLQLNEDWLRQHWS